MTLPAYSSCTLEWRIGVISMSPPAAGNRSAAATAADATSIATNPSTRRIALTQPHDQRILVRHEIHASDFALGRTRTPVDLEHEANDLRPLADLEIHTVYIIVRSGDEANQVFGFLFDVIFFALGDDRAATRRHAAHTTSRSTNDMRRMTRT